MIRRLRTDLAVCCGFFTRLPVGFLMPHDPRIDMAGAVWAFPLAGALAGLCGGVVYVLTAWLGLAPALSACWSLGAMVLLTGGLHEDGLADMADGFGGARDAPGKLAIMRDSRIGSHGALALLLSSVVRIAAAGAIADPWSVGAALVASGALSRAAIVLVLVLLPPARRDGLASVLHPVPHSPAILAFAIALGIAVAASATRVHGWSMLVAAVGAALTVLIIARLARAQIGGHTGDVLGACSVLVECVVLSSLSLR